MVMDFLRYTALLDKYRDNATLISTSLSVMLILSFFVIFPVSPFTDLIGLIIMGFAPHSLAPYYVAYGGPSYQLFQSMVFLIQLFAGDNLAIACVIFMFFVFLLLLGIVFFFTTFTEENNYCIFCMLPALAFFLMHTTLFVWGTLPFIISSWLAILASFFYLKFYLHGKTNVFSVRNKWLVLSIATGLLSGFTHPIGIQIYLIGINFFILLSVFRNRNRLQNILTIFAIDILFLLYDFITLTSFNQISTENFSFATLVNPDIFPRLVWIAGGGGYSTSMLFPARVSTIEQYLLPALGLLPFICLILGIILVFISRRKKEKVNPVNGFATYFLCVICAGIIFLPVMYRALSIPYIRMYAVATPLLLIIIFNTLNLFPLHISSKLLAGIGLVLTVLVLVSFTPSYSGAQNIIPFSDNLTDKLQQNVLNLRDTLPDNEKNLPVLITYDPSHFGEKNNEYRIVPFIMMDNKVLYNNNTIIVTEWARALGPEGPHYLNFDYVHSVKKTDVHWQTDVYPDIKLSVSKTLDPV